MNASNDPVLDRIENADRMLRQARVEHQRGNADDVTEFLAAARRNIERATEALQKAAALAPQTEAAAAEAPQEAAEASTIGE